MKKDADDKDAGVTIQEVFAGSPAAAANLKAGDRLLTLMVAGPITWCWKATKRRRCFGPVKCVVIRARRQGNHADSEDPAGAVNPAV